MKSFVCAIHLQHPDGGLLRPAVKRTTGVMSDGHGLAGRAGNPT